MNSSVVTLIDHIRNNYMIMEHPKCGRTWLNHILRHTVMQEYNINLEDKTSFIGLNHDGQALQNRKEKYSRSKKYDNNRSIIFMVRDPRDVMVSFYFAVKRPHRKHMFSGNISEFIRSKFGIKHMMLFLYDWSRIIESKEDIMWLKYEDLKRYTFEEIKSVFNFLPIKVSDKSIKYGIEKSEFERMQKEEIADRSDINIDELQIRRGIIGGYKDYLNDEDIGYIEDYMFMYQCFLVEQYLNEDFVFDWRYQS